MGMDQLADNTPRPTIMELQDIPMVKNVQEMLDGDPALFLLNPGHAKALYDLGIVGKEDIADIQRGGGLVERVAVLHLDTLFDSPKFKGNGEAHRETLHSMFQEITTPREGKLEVAIQFMALRVKQGKSIVEIGEDPLVQGNLADFAQDYRQKVSLARAAERFVNDPRIGDARMDTIADDENTPFVTLIRSAADQVLGPRDEQGNHLTASIDELEQAAIEAGLGKRSSLDAVVFPQYIEDLGQVSVSDTQVLLPSEYAKYVSVSSKNAYVIRSNRDTRTGQRYGIYDMEKVFTGAVSAVREEQRHTLLSTNSQAVLKTFEAYFPQASTAERIHALRALALSLDAVPSQADLLRYTNDQSEPYVAPLWDMVNETLEKNEAGDWVPKQS